jgi:hypothetical protein
MVEDNLNYICDNPADSKVLSIKVCYKTYDLKSNCIYETRSLITIYNPPKYNGPKSLGPLKMSLEMAHKVIVPQKKIMSRSFLKNSGTLLVNRSSDCPVLLHTALPLYFFI